MTHLHQCDALLLEPAHGPLEDEAARHNIPGSLFFPLLQQLQPTVHRGMAVINQHQLSEVAKGLDPPCTRPNLLAHHLPEHV